MSHFCLLIPRKPKNPEHLIEGVGYGNIVAARFPPSPITKKSLFGYREGGEEIFLLERSGLTRGAPPLWTESVAGSRDLPRRLILAWRERKQKERTEDAPPADVANDTRPRLGRRV